MDVWSSQNGGATQDERTGGEEEDYELADSGKDALVVLIDARASMFAPYEPPAVDSAKVLASSLSPAPQTWFHAVVDLVVKLLKAKVIANDNSLISVVFFGSRKRGEANNLESVYEFQALGYPSATRIKELQALLEEGVDAQRELQSMANGDPIAISNALWHCGIAFSNANLKKKDTQRVWLFTNDDAPSLPDAEERGRVQKQVQNHIELKRTLNLFYITPPGRDVFNLATFYACAFKDYAADGDDSDATTLAADGSAIHCQPAFPVDSLDDLTEGSLRKRFRKRRITSFPLHITKDVSLGVELYALAVVQRKSPPVALDASTNAPLKSTTKWLCEDTGAYLTPDQIKRYIEFGGKRVYFTRDDVVQLKHFDAPGLQLICFKPASSLQWHTNIRAPYFVYPSEGYIEGSTKAFVALLRAMVAKRKIALARLIARRSSEPRLVALVPQEEVADELGQVQPSGLNVIFLPYVDDIRDIPVESRERATRDKIDAAKALLGKLKLTEVPSFENPELQKHYSSVQALALGEEELSFDESRDTTLPDEEGFAQDDVKSAIAAFKDVCGGDAIDTATLKRKASTTPARTTAAKKGTSADDLSKDHWSKLVASNSIQKKTVAQIKDFLQAHGIAAVGKKAELMDKVRDFVDA